MELQQLFKDYDNRLSQMRVMPSYQICRSCNAPFATNLVLTKNGAMTMCSSCCFGFNLFKCHACGRLMLTELCANIEPSICVGCVSVRKSKCLGCSTGVSVGFGGQTCRSCTKTYCDVCYQMFKHPCTLKNNTYNGTFTKTKSKGEIITIPRFFGVEIEAEGPCGYDTCSGQRYFADTLPLCDVGPDGSLTNGIEIKTNPAMMKQGEKIIKAVCKTLGEEGFTIKSTCGLHVHVDARDFRTDLNKISKLFKTVYSVEDLIYAMLTPNRSKNTYCKPIREGYKYGDFALDMKEEELLTNWYKNKDLKRVVQNKRDHHDGTRYRGLNLHALLYMGTVEFRYSHGRMAPRDIQYWVQFLLSLVDYAVNNYSSKEVSTLLRIKSLTAKIAYLSKIMRFDTNMKKYILYSIEHNNPKKLKLMKGSK